MDFVELGPLLVVDRQYQHEVGEVRREEAVLEPRQNQECMVDQVRLIRVILHQNVQHLNVVVHRQVCSFPPLSVSTF